MQNRGSTLILTKLVGVQQRNIHTKSEANPCSGSRIEVNKSNTECGIIRPTNAIYMGLNSLHVLGSKALSKCEMNPTSGFQDIAFTSNKLLWRPSWFS